MKPIGPALFHALRLSSAALLTAGTIAVLRAQEPARRGTVTFARDVAPILFARCSACHHPDGSAPFSLLTYSSARQRAAQIADVTKSRFMPPWKTEPGDGPFIGQQPLTDGEIAVIQRWVEGGAVEGDPDELPPQPQLVDGWQLGQPDLIVGPAAPYTLQGDGTDVFRIFVLRLPVLSLRFVRGLEFRPGNPKVVHHANIKIDRTMTSRRLDDQDPDPGYEGLVAVSVADPDGYFLGWTPGQVAPLLPKGFSWQLEPGTDLVVELHMQPSGKPELVQPSIGLFFSDDPPERTPVMLRLGRQSIDIAAGEKNYVITDSFVLPIDVEVQALQPHAHYRAREVSGVATLPDGTTRPMIHITNWDFRWQHVYRFVSPVPLPKGSTVAMRYTYDNSPENPRNPQHPPGRVIWGQRSANEMGDLWIQFLTRDEHDRVTLNRAIRPKMTAESIVGYETLIRADPTRVSLHDDVALLYRELGRHDEEIAHFGASLKLQPESAAAHFNLGAALADAGRLDEAVERYRSALQLRPDHLLAHSSLGHVLIAQGKLDQAMDQYREALRVDPGNAVAHNNLGFIILERGSPLEALPHFRRALGADANYADAHYNMGRALRSRGDLSGATDHFRDAARIKPDWAPALVNLAWLLAAAPNDELRDPNEALRLAERANDLAGPLDGDVQDVLAAAYAAAGLFDRAIDAATAALRVMPQSRAAEAVRDRLELYRQQKTYRLPVIP